MRWRRLRFSCDRVNERSLWVCFEGAVAPKPSTFDEPLRTKRQAISAEPSALDPSKLTDLMLTSYRKTKEWTKETKTRTHARVRAWTVVTFECICRSGELIQKALMNNDFMKHLEHGQVMTQPPHSSRSCFGAANWLALLADSHHHGLHVSNPLVERLLRHPGGRRWIHRLRPRG